eukprot:3402511-Rhodomonas_salina.2
MERSCYNCVIAFVLCYYLSVPVLLCPASRETVLVQLLSCTTPGAAAVIPYLCQYCARGMQRTVYCCSVSVLVLCAWYAAACVLGG